MSTTIHRALASVVKVTVGPANGNRVGRIIFRDGVIPDGVEPEQLKRLVERGLIESVKVLSTEELEAQAAADVAAAQAQVAADAQAAADAKATADAKAAEASAKKASTTPAK